MIVEKIYLNFITFSSANNIEKTTTSTWKLKTRINPDQTPIQKSMRFQTENKREHITCEIFCVSEILRNIMFWRMMIIFDFHNFHPFPSIIISDIYSKKVYFPCCENCRSLVSRYVRSSHTETSEFPKSLLRNEMWKCERCVAARSRWSEKWMKWKFSCFPRWYTFSVYDDE